MDDFIRHSEGKTFSDQDIRNLCEGRVRVIEYHDLARHRDVDSALGKTGAMIVLYETKHAFGHWCAVIAHPDDDSIEFFDPYGLEPDEELDFVPEYFRAESGQDFPHLSYLLENSPYSTIIYNDVPLQRMKKDTNTCGRWCGLRVALRHIPIEDFAEMFLNQSHSPDYYVTALTMFV